MREVAVAAGLDAPPGIGANPRLDVKVEAAHWLAKHPQATPIEAWRAGCFRAWAHAQNLLREWRRRWYSQTRTISVLQSRLGVVLQILRRDDSG